MEAPRITSATSLGRHAAAIPAPSSGTEEGSGSAVDGRMGKPVRKIRNKRRMFDRRRDGLFKAAKELSVDCKTEVGAIVFSREGSMSEFASSSMSHIMKRYQSVHPQRPSSSVLFQDVKTWKYDANLLNNKLKYLQECQRSMFEKNSSFSISEVNSLETMLTHALTKIHERKLDLLEVETQKVIEKEEILCKRNNELKKKISQILSKEYAMNATSPSQESSHHQDICSSTLDCGSDVLQGKEQNGESFLSKN